MHLFASFESIISIPQELASHGHKATLIPVLSFKFVSLNTLSDKVNYIVHTYKLFFKKTLNFVVLWCYYSPAFPTRETWRSHIYKSESSGGCEDVFGSRGKTGRWEGQDKYISANPVAHLYNNLNPFTFYYVCALLIEFWTNFTPFGWNDLIS